MDWRQSANRLSGLGRSPGIEAAVGQKLLEISQAAHAITRCGEHELGPPVHTVACHAPAPDGGMHLTNEGIDGISGATVYRHSRDHPSAITQDAKLVAGAFESDGPRERDRAFLRGKARPVAAAAAGE
jgi:hypothetical protein